MRKQTFILELALLFLTVALYGQAKKPTLMVVPSDAWCNKNGYMIEFDNQGILTKVPDYTKAVQENTDLLLVISKLNGLMAKREFPLKNLESVLKNLTKDRGLNAVRASRDNSASVAESPVDQIIKTAKADIILQLTWTVNKVGPESSISYNLQGLDAYTNKQVATATGTGLPSFSAELPILLEEAVEENIEDFTYTLQEHFDDMFKNGREVTLQILTWEDWDGDLDELSFEIEDWLDSNTIEGRFSTTDVTDTYALFEQVRIPLYNERGRALDARNFFRALSKKLSSPPHSITNKLATEGLGKVTLILGSK
ncbi:DUF6175 family protein [uncultured Croceitalea sp.]|uniref:DUF6175 family protein n=1 Tax=uncultured Croceitalea sp. TaxID=1798908 RepID=UPI00330686EE